MTDLQALITGGRTDEAVHAARGMSVERIFSASQYEVMEDHLDEYDRFFKSLYADTADPLRRLDVALQASGVYATALVLVPGYSSIPFRMELESVQHLATHLAELIGSWESRYVTHPEMDLSPDTYARLTGHAQRLRQMDFFPTAEEAEAHRARVAERDRQLEDQAAAGQAAKKAKIQARRDRREARLAAEAAGEGMKARDR